jgi:hypothetical protein
MTQHGATNSHEDVTPDMAYPVADERNANEHSLLKLPLFLAFNPGATYRMQSRMLPVSRMRHCRVATDNHCCHNGARWLNVGCDDCL